MRVVFFGTPEFAASILEAIVHEGKDQVVAVVTKPDAPSGRNLTLTKTPVKEISNRLLPSVPVLEPLVASAPETIDFLKQFEADVFYVVGYGEILKQSILDIPKQGCFNVHASLLPLYRGAAPIQRALLNGCTKTGISIFRLTKGMDSGDIVWQKSCNVGKEMNFQELTNVLVDLAKEGTAEVFRLIRNGLLKYVPQHHEEATLAPKIVPEDLILDLSADIEDLHNQIRAFAPKPGAYFHVMYKDIFYRLKILKSHLVDTSFATIRSLLTLPDKKLGLTTPTGTLIFDIVQLQSKQAMPSDQFLRGIPLSEILFLPKELDI